MSLQQILISTATKPEHREKILACFPDAQVRFARFSELTDQDLARFDAVVGNPNLDQLKKMTNLKMLQLESSGVIRDYLQLKDLRPGAVLCSASGAFGQAISEHMLGALLMLMKNLHQYRDDMKQGLWKNRGTVYSPRGMTVLLIGAGSIGRDFARLMKPMGAVTIGLKRTPGQPDEDFDRMYTMEQLDSLLPEADVVAMSLPETELTKGLMDRRRFELMKDGSYLLNVGRGSAINQEDLLWALDSGKLRGASIDVTVPEPLPADHPLWQRDNLLLTPHISGFFQLRQTHDNVIDIACRNLKAYPDGPYIAQTDFESGYRKSGE